MQQSVVGYKVLPEPGTQAKDLENPNCAHYIQINPNPNMLLICPIRLIITRSHAAEVSVRDEKLPDVCQSL